MMFSCLCFGSRPQGNTKQKKEKQKKQKQKKQDQKLNDKSPSSANPASAVPVPQTVQASEHEGRTRSFTYRELATATNNFRAESMIGRGGFGRVFKGTLESTGQEVAVKVLDPDGAQGEREFLVEVLMLSLIRHENLVRLIGYCDEGEQRLLVYEYMPLGSVEDHMHNDNIGRETLDWNKRMRIAAGAAKGLQQLHNVAIPPVIFRDMKTANILLDNDFNVKLSDFGLARFGPTGDASHISTNVMGTLGYCAPEYAQSGKLTIKSDIYSFGVVLLELISGRKALTGSSSMSRQCFIGDWALALFKKNKLNDIVDPMITIKGRHMEATLRKALEVAFMCIKEEANDRPTIREIVVALNYIVKCTTCKKKKKRSGSGSGGDSEKTGSSSEGTSRNLNEELDRKRRVAEAKDWAIDHLKRKSIEQPSSSSSYKT